MAAKQRRQIPRLDGTGEERLDEIMVASFVQGPGLGQAVREVREARERQREEASSAAQGPGDMAYYLRKAGLLA